MITIGHLSLLLPDDVGVATVVKTLSKGLPCFYYPGARSVELRKDDVQVSLSYVNASTPIKDEDGGDVQPHAKAKKARPLALKPPTFLALMERRDT
ncbi:MAG: hypothetical protein ABL974_22775 [Prosthecobacter sp.]